jgi:hypothetical protein
MKVSNKSVIHRRLKCFVEYIASEKEKRDKIKDQSDQIRTCIQSQSILDGYTILASPYSGSFAVKTGLRRSLHGNNEVEGQDIDLSFILKDEDKDGNPLGCFVKTFEKYLKNTWPQSEIGTTKSSAYIKFANTKQQFDTVPLIETKRKGIQKLKRTNNSERQSSVENHADFIKTRTESSNNLVGVVKFNDCVRLIKWWKYQRQTESTVFGNNENDEKVPSFLLSLLCAFAYDECSVKETYADTLKSWFSFLAHVVREKVYVNFDDFISKHENNNSGHWQVIDPMDDSNNITKNWSIYKVDELAKWFEKGRDKMMEAIRRDEDQDDSGSLNCLVELFGNSIKNQCKN